MSNCAILATQEREEGATVQEGKVRGVREGERDRETGDGLVKGESYGD